MERRGGLHLARKREVVLLRKGLIPQCTLSFMDLLLVAFFCHIAKTNERGLSESSQRVSKLLHRDFWVYAPSLSKNTTQKWIYQCMCKFCVEVVLVRSTKKNLLLCMQLHTFFLVLEITGTNTVPKAVDSSRLGQQLIFPYIFFQTFT